jgi:hypothetical protein
MNFDEFASFSQNDISRFRGQYETMFDCNGTIISDTIGFHFSMGNIEKDTNAKDIFKTFVPFTIWCGRKDMVDKVKKMGFYAELYPFFEDGGFAVVLKTPRSVMRHK